MRLFAKAAVLTTAVIVAGWGLVGCAKEPDADYLETDITSLMRGVPGDKYKLIAPEFLYLKGDVGLITDGETIMVVEGDDLEEKLSPLLGSDYMLLGVKAGKPYVHFRATGVVVAGELTPITDEVPHKLPLYRPADDELFAEYEEVDLSQVPFDSKKKIDSMLMKKKAIIEGVLEPFEVAGLKRYAVRNGDSKVVLEPVTENLGIFLQLLEKKGGRFVAAGMLTSIRDWDDGTENDREATHILGDFKVDYLKYGHVAVPNM